jgi:hypothetical protein
VCSIQPIEFLGTCQRTGNSKYRLTNGRDRKSLNYPSQTPIEDNAYAVNDDFGLVPYEYQQVKEREGNQWTS